MNVPTNLHRRYVQAGKEVLQDGHHFADARDDAAAALIAAGLNLVELQQRKMRKGRL